MAIRPIRRGPATDEIFERARRAVKVLHTAGIPASADEVTEIPVAAAQRVFEGRRRVKMESYSKPGHYYFIDPSFYGYARYELWTE